MNLENVVSAGTDGHLGTIEMRGHPRTILLVDDSPVNLGVAVDNLEMHGYDVLVALDGEEALQRARVAKPDIILLDVMLPGIDGFEACLQLKADENTRDIPVIFMTSLGGIQDKVNGFDVGAVDYITKPLQIEEAKARINTHLELRALRQSLEAQDSKLQFEIAEREKAEAALRGKVEKISELNHHLEIQAEELTASREQLQYTEAWYRSIVHSAPDGMMVVNQLGRIVLVNESLVKMFGYAEGEMLGQPMEILLPTEVRGRHVAKREGFFADGHKEHPSDFIADGLRASRKDGGEFPVDVSLSRLPDMGGCASVVCVAVRDITRRKKMEEVLLESQRLLNEAQRAQMEQRQSRMDAIGTLAAGIAHDFNNILGSIVGFAEMVGDELALDSAERRGIQQILIASFRARDLIARMLTFARQNQGNHLLPMDAITQIREALALLEGACAPDLEITFGSDVEPAMVLAESGQLQQIVMNLCINAADAMNYRGVIAVGVAPVELDDGLPGICLRVTDSGHGMTPEVQERIFDPFFTTKAHNKGAGLGLSVVYGIVRQLGGQITVQSRVAESDHGTEFSVLLRLTAIPAEGGEIGHPPPSHC